MSENEMLTLRKPISTDGPAITSLIKACPPLDQNSAYCNLLQCTDFADTCVVAEMDGQISGWVSGYIPPNAPNTYFLWQVAVHERARGQKLAAKMVSALLTRPEIAHTRYLKTTITPDNKASWALFQTIARRFNAPLTDEPWFTRDDHFAGAHSTEHMVTIGPLNRAARAA